MALSALAISAIIKACVVKSMPWPPYSVGTAAVRMPSFEPFLMMFQSNVPAGSAIWSRANDSGRISVSANSRALSCQARWMSVIR